MALMRAPRHGRSDGTHSIHARGSARHRQALLALTRSRRDGENGGPLRQQPWGVVEAVS
jgi:hypothetical protein